MDHEPVYYGDSDTPGCCIYHARLAVREPIAPPVVGLILCSIVAGVVGFVLGLATGWGWA